MLGWFRKDNSPPLVADIEPADLPYCADIHASSFDKPWSDGTLAEMLASKGMKGILARRGNLHRESQRGKSIRGFLMYRTMAGEAEIITIATAKADRGTGIGRALLEEMIRRCLADRLEAIFLEVDEANAAAIALYRKFGFREVGKRKAYYRPSKPTGTSGAAASGAGSTLANQPAAAHDAIIMRLSLRD